MIKIRFYKYKLTKLVNLLLFIKPFLQEIAVFDRHLNSTINSTHILLF